ncbi:MAG: hypothetical protein QOF29_593, partial [bacterium]
MSPRSAARDTDGAGARAAVCRGHAPAAALGL